MLLLCALMAGSGSAWAEETVTTVATFTSSDAVTASGYASTYGGDDWSISMGGNNKSIGFNNKNCTTIGDNLGTNATASNYGVVVKSKNKLSGVSRITFVYTGGSGDGGKLYLAYSTDNSTWNAITLNSGEGLSTQGVTVSQNTTFTFDFAEISDAYYGFILDKGNTTTAAYRFDNVTVTFLNVVTTADAALTGISVSGTPTTFYTDDTFNTDGITVTATYDDDTTKDVTDEASFTGYDMATAGTQTVNVSYTEGDVTKTASFSITVNERPKFTVTLGDDNTEIEESSVGAGVVLPSRSAAGYTFAGWTDTELNVETSNAPALLIPAGSYYPSADITLFPVYSRVSAGTTVMPDVTLTISDYATAHSWADGTKYESITINSNLTATINDDNDSNTGKYYTSNTSWRIYEAGTGFTLTAATGYTLASVVFTYDKNNNGVIVFGDSQYTSGTEITLSGSSASFTVTHSDGTKNGNVQIKEIVVGYKSTSQAYYISHPVTSVTKTVTSAGWATFAPEYPVSFGSEEAYIINSASESGTTLTEVSSVPAGTPVLLKGGGEHTLSVVASSSTDVSSNCLKVSDGTVTKAAGVYVLADGNYGVGFYLWVGVSALSAGKIYMEPNVTTSRAFFSLDGYASGIGTLLAKGEGMKGEVYSLSGQRVARPAKGLYIVNGKKVIIK